MSDWRERQRQKDDAAAAALAQNPAKPPLLAYLLSRRQEAVDARSLNGIDADLEDCQRRRAGKYTAGREAELKAAGVPVFWSPITSTKCRQTEQRVREYMIRFGERAWTAEPTPDPDLPESVAMEAQDAANVAFAEALANGTQMSLEEVAALEAAIKDELLARERDLARARVGRMATKIEDLLTEANWNISVQDEFISNTVTYGTGFIKGVVVRNLPRRSWNPKTRKPTVSIKPTPTVAAPNPFDIFPAPWATTTQDPIFERCRSYRASFAGMRGLPYYQTAEIDAFLKEHPQGANASQVADTQARDSGERKGTVGSDNRLEYWEYHGPIEGYMLKLWGKEFADFEDVRDYEVEVLFTDQHVLKVMPNWNEMGTHPYVKTTLFQIPGSFWGIGMPLAVKPSQDKANGASCALLHNMGWASGPMGQVDVNRLQDPTEAASWFPGKLWHTTNDQGLTVPAVAAILVPSLAGPLQSIYRDALVDADNESNMPAYQFGGAPNTGAAGSTARGLSMQLSASDRGVTEIVGRMGQEAIGPLIQIIADFLNMYSDDESIKGDIRIVSKGITAFMGQALMQDGLRDFLDRTANPIDMQIFGAAYAPFRLGIHRKLAELMRLEIVNLIPEDAPQPPMLPGAEEPNSGGRNAAGTPTRTEQPSTLPAGSR